MKREVIKLIKELEKRKQNADKSRCSCEEKNDDSGFFFFTGKVSAFDFCSKELENLISK